MSIVRDKLIVKKSSTQIVKEVFCEEHQIDLEHIVQSVDDLIATAVSSGSSSQSYSELQRAKSQFIDDLIRISGKYRIVTQAI